MDHTRASFISLLYTSHRAIPSRKQSTRRTISISKSSAPAAPNLFDRMASIVSRPRRSVQMYWARRNYQRLGGSPSRHLKVARLGGVGGRTRALGTGAALRRRLRWMAMLMLSPARLLQRLRDAYVDAMLALAAGGVARPCAALATAKPGEKGALWAKRVPRARSSARSSDFERRMMAHIYSTLVTPELPGAVA